MHRFNPLAIRMKKMTSRLVFAGLLAVLLGACSGDSGRPPNIVLVSIDTLRWDYLETYGYPEKNVSPTVSWLAENGIVFDQAVVSAGTTVPSHGTMLTGLYPRMHGARSNFHGLYPGTATVTQALAEAGYQTGAFVSVNTLTKVGELGRGFQAQSYPSKDEKKKRQPRSGARTIAEAAKWLDSVDPGKPVFVWLHLWEPHGPYDLTDWGREKMGDYAGMLKDGAKMTHLQKQTSEIVNSKENVAALQALYAGEVNLADRYLGKFLEDWKSRNLLANTVVIFTADHGQGLGERKKMGHGATHAEHVIRVPMIVSDFRSPRHQRVQTRVGAIDISPTIAQLAGLEQSFNWLGSSLLQTESLDPDKPYFAEVELRTQTDEQAVKETFYDPNAVAVWSGDFKLVVRKGKYQMFETSTGNSFPKPLVLTEEPIMFDYLSGLIEAFQKTKLDMTSGEVTEEQLKELQGLGYTQ